MKWRANIGIVLKHISYPEGLSGTTRECRGDDAEPLLNSYTFADVKGVGKGYVTIWKIHVKYYNKGLT